MQIGFGEKELIIAASILLGLCMLLKTGFLYVHMWKNGTERKSVLSFLVFEIFVAVYLWVPYEKKGMSGTAVFFQRVVTGGIWFGLVLMGLWWLLFQ